MSTANYEYKSPAAQDSLDQNRFLRPSERFARTGIFGENGLYGQGGSLNPRSSSNATDASLYSPVTTPSSPVYSGTSLSSPATSPPVSRKGSLAPPAGIYDSTSVQGPSFLQQDPSGYPLPPGASSHLNNANLPSLSFKDLPKPKREQLQPISPADNTLSPQTPSKKKGFFSSLGRSSRKEASSSALSDDEGPSRPSRFSRSFSSSSGKRSKSLGTTSPGQTIAAAEGTPGLQQSLDNEWVVLQQSDESKSSLPIKVAENGGKAINYSKPRQYSESAVQRPTIVQTPPPVSKRHPKEEKASGLPFSSGTPAKRASNALPSNSPPFYLNPGSRQSTSPSDATTVSPVPSQPLSFGGPLPPSATSDARRPSPIPGSSAGLPESSSPTARRRQPSPAADMFRATSPDRNNARQQATSPSQSDPQNRSVSPHKQPRTSVGHPSVNKLSDTPDRVPLPPSAMPRVPAAAKSQRQSMPAPSRSAGHERLDAPRRPSPSVTIPMSQSLQSLDQLRGPQSPQRRPPLPELPGQPRSTVSKSGSEARTRTRTNSAPAKAGRASMASKTPKGTGFESSHGVQPGRISGQSTKADSSTRSSTNSAIYEGQPRFAEALTQHIGVLSSLLDFADYESLHALRRVSSALRGGLAEEDRKELILQRYLGGIGYRTLAGVKPSASTAAVNITLRDLHAFIASTEFSLSEYTIFASEHKRQALDLRTQRMMRASTRAHNKLVIRLRIQSSSHLAALSQPYWAKLGIQASIYKPGRTAVLRVWTPCAGTWMTDNELVECEREVYRSGVWKLLMKGDLVRNVAQSDIANEGVVIFDGKFLRDLSYAHDPVGHTPSWMNALAFSPSHYHNQLASSGSTPVLHLDLTPFVQSIQANMKLCQEKAEVSSPSGDRYRVNRYVYRTVIDLRPGTILGDAGGQGGSGPGGIESLHKDWEGQLIIETEGTSEAAKELISRAEGVSRTVLPNQPRVPVDINNHPYRVIRNLSRPGQIWVKPVIVEKQKKR